MSAFSIDCLMRSCHELQQELLRVAPQHPLNQCNTENYPEPYWEVITIKFYQHFTGVLGSMHKLQNEHYELAWTKFKNELYLALYFAKTDPHPTIH